MDGTHYTTIGMDVSDRKTQVCAMGGPLNLCRKFQKPP